METYIVLGKGKHTMDYTHDNLAKLFWNGENEKKERLKLNEEGIRYALLMALKDFTPRTEKREENVSFAAKEMLCELEKNDNYIGEFVAFFDEKPKNRGEFDRWHERMCNIFLNRFYQNDKKDNKANKYGKAQKVINMTFKYIYCLEGAKEKEKQGYFKFCHMPLDSITLEWFYRLKEKGVKIMIDNKEEKICRKYPSWSNLSKEYREEKGKSIYGYIDIQNTIRKYLENNTELTPLKAEFIIWPQMQLALAEERLFSQLIGAEKDYYESQTYHKIFEKYDKKIPLPKQMGNNYKNRLNEWFRKLSVKEKTQCLNEMLTQISKVKQSGLIFEEI